MEQRRAGRRKNTTTEIVGLLLDAELELVELRVVARTRPHGSGREVVDFLESSAFGNFLRVVPEDLRPSLRADLEAAFEALRTPDGVVGVREWGTMLVARRA